MTRVNPGSNNGGFHPKPMKRTALKSLRGHKVTWEPSKRLLSRSVSLPQLLPAKQVSFKVNKSGNPLGIWVNKPPA